MAADKPHAGAIVGSRFQLVAGLGAGSFGSVWRAKDLTDQTVVAIKFLHPKLRRSKAIVERFMKEAEVLERLAHDNIVRVVDWQVERTRIFLALEFVEGGTLAAEIIGRAQRETGFDKAEIQVLVTQICEAVGHAHERKIVHRDLKPANVMLPSAEDQPRVKVLDFGIAKTFDESASRMTTVGRILGTRSYLAPEQILGAQIDHRADLFSLGTIFFELLTMHRAWLRDGTDRCVRPHLAGDYAKDNTHLAVLRRIQKSQRPRASDYAPELSPEVDNVLFKAMAIDRESRFENADELRRALLSALDTTYHASASLPRIPPLNTATAAEVSNPLEQAVATPAILDVTGSSDAEPEPEPELSVTPILPTPTNEVSRPLTENISITRTPTGTRTTTSTSWAVAALVVAVAFAGGVWMFTRDPAPVVAQDPTAPPPAPPPTGPVVSPGPVATPEEPPPSSPPPPRSPPPPPRRPTKSTKRVPPPPPPPPTVTLTPAQSAARSLRGRLSSIGTDDGAAARRAKLCDDIDAAATTHLDGRGAKSVRRCTAMARLAPDSATAMNDLKRCLRILGK